jgi:hypothetical protein
MTSTSPGRDAPPAVDDGLSVAMIGDDLFALLTPTETLGFVHRVGTVYVALRGSDYHRAVEVGQSLSWDRAVQVVRTA